MSPVPRRSRLRLPPLRLGNESFGERLARIRKDRGFTQAELAEKTGLIQALVSDYELDKLRLRADMTVRFALALEVSTDELLGLKMARSNGRRSSRRVQRRLEQIEQLPSAHQRALLKTIDIYVKGAQKVGAAGGNGNGRGSGG